MQTNDLTALQGNFHYDNMVTLINNTQDLMWSIGTDRKMIAFNRAFAELIKQMTGLSVTIGGDPPQSGFEPERLQRWDDYYKRAFSGEIFSIVEYTDAPVEYWADISFYPAVQNGKVIGANCYSRNITELKLFERELEKRNAELEKLKNKLQYSENSLREAQEMAHVGSWLNDFENNINMWSDEAYRILGLDQANVIPSLDTYLSVIHKDDLPRVKSLIEKGYKDPQPYSYKCRIMQPNGEIRYILCNCRFGIDPSGRATKILGVLQDISERTKVESKLRHNELRLKQAQAIAHVGHWEVSFATKTSSWSDEAYRIYGLEPGDHNFSFQQWLAFIHPDDTNSFLAEMKRCEANYDDLTHCHRIVRPNGEIRSVISECRYEIINGQAIGLYGAVQDITEKVALEEKLLQSHRLLENLTDYVPAAVYQFEMNDNGQMSFPFMSKGIHQILPGIDTEVIKNDVSSLFSMVHPDDAAGLARSIEGSRMNQSNWEYEFRAMVGDEQKWIYGASTYEKKNNGITVWYGYLKDVTESKQSEVLLMELNERLERRAEELVKSNTELEQFAYIASHDLQEPLRMITSFLTQLELKYKDKLDDKARQYIHFATSGAVRMRTIILDLLEYSRVGRRPAEKDLIDTSEVLFEAVQLNRAVIDEKKAIIKWQELPVIKTNRLSLQQLFQNLIGNALKYQEPGRQPVIEISACETPTHWQFSFKDNGIGIEPRFFDKIFAVFQRLHQREEYSGTGIGLAICKKIVENHRGQIWVESTPKLGSTFHCTFEKN